MAPLPLVGCICFWGTQGLKGVSLFRQRVVKSILVLIAGVALFTNFLFTYYPNIFNIAAVNWQQEQSLYRANFNFDNDANFVRSWVLPSQRAALISGFETQILLQADRAPFFYGSQSLMGQLVDGKPDMVFIDKRILSLPGNRAIGTLIDYLKAHYQYTEKQGLSLVLLQRNHE
jgi:hypothetical protein